jgi:hypothetical protein
MISSSASKCALLAALLLWPACGKDAPTPDTGSGIDQDVPNPGPKDKGVPDQGIPRNSGRICTTEKECAAGDTCLSFWGSSKKMCLTPCSPSYEVCEVPNPGTQTSRCYYQASPTLHYCLWFCEYQGKKYECPVPEAFECFAPNSSQPGLKICRPK